MPEQPQAEDRFETTVGVRSSEVDEPAIVASQRHAERRRAALVVDQPLPQSGLERREEALLTTASEQLAERVDDADAPTIGGIERACRDGRRSSRLELVRMQRDAHRPVIGVDPGVDAFIVPEVERPQAVLAGCRDACDQAAVAQRLEDRG